MKQSPVLGLKNTGTHGSSRTPVRLAGALIALACLALLTVASGVQAEAEGHGTHEQLGLPACQWAQQFNMPCATCGMTTSFAHAADGNVVASFVNQPMGALLAVLTAMVFWGGAHVAVTGSRIGSIVMGFVGGKLLIVAGVLLVAAWVYKIITW